MSATDYDALKFHEGLVKAGLIIPVGVQGAFGRNLVFESVLEGFNNAVTRLAKNDGASRSDYDEKDMEQRSPVGRVCATWCRSRSRLALCSDAR